MPAELTVEPRNPDETSGSSRTASIAPKDPTPRFSVNRRRDLPARHVDQTIRRNGVVEWDTVTLDIQYADCTEDLLEPIPFLFICRSMECIPGNIRIDLIEAELQKQEVITDDYFLRLKGSSQVFDWNLKDMCMALTIWRRSRSGNAFDVSLLLVPRGLPDIDVDVDLEENVTSNRRETLTINTDEPSRRNGYGAIRLTEDDRATLANDDHRVAEPNKNKRKRAHLSLTTRSDHENHLSNSDPLVATRPTKRPTQTLRRGRSMVYPSRGMHNQTSNAYWESSADEE